MRIRFFALAALALSLAACTQDEAGFLPEGAQGCAKLKDEVYSLTPARCWKVKRRCHRKRSIELKPQ